MSGRWIARFIAVLMLLGFFLLFANLQTRLLRIQQQQQPASAPGNR